MKSIKWEPKDFPVIKLLNQWDSVKRAVNAMATVLTILEWILVMVDTVPLIIWLVYVALMRNSRVFE
jgi:hypothetical protein